MDILGREIIGRDGATLEDLWHRIIDSEHLFYAYVTKRGGVEIAKENSQKRMILEASDSLLIGVYNCGIERGEFCDDVMATLAEWRANGGQ